jgi:pimeloyl-ACP methyl ester carboxylesterase
MIKAERAVVLVHGLWMTPLTLMPLARRLARAGFDPVLFPYSPVRAPMTEHADRLAETLRGIAQPTVHLVGHSLGGLVALFALGARPLPPGRVVCLGTPLGGSLSAARLARYGWGRWMAGASLAPLCTGVAALPGDREVAAIAGALPLGLGRLLGTAQGPNDGVVSIAETRAAGLAAHAVIPVNHLGLLLSPRVAGLIVRFLAHGRF